MNKYLKKFIFAYTLFLMATFSGSSAFADTASVVLDALSDLMNGASWGEIAVGVGMNIFGDWAEGLDASPNTTALFKAVTNPATKPQEIRDIEARGVDINQRREFNNHLYFKDTGEVTPLMCAAAITPDPEVITTLIELGAGVNHNSDIWWGAGYNPLAFAMVFNKNPEIAATLIRCGADVTEKMFIAELSRENPRPGIIREMIRSGGIDVNARYDNDRTALMQADKIEIIRELINNGADVNAKDKKGRTVLMQTDNPEIIKEIVNAGADVNAKDEDGKTALMKTYNLEIIKELIKNGADVNLQDNDDWTALMYAAKNSPPDVVRTLLSAGADTGIKGDDWFIFSVTALDLAKDRLEDKDNTDKRAAQEIVELLNTQQGFFSRILDNISRFFGGIFRFIVKCLIVFSIVCGAIFYWIYKRSLKEETERKYKNSRPITKYGYTTWRKL